VPFEFSTPVRFADVDHAGIVYYPRFFHYFHMAFEELFRARLGPRAYVDLLDKDRVGFPAVHAEADYHAPLKFGDTATIALSVAKLGVDHLPLSGAARRRPLRHRHRGVRGGRPGPVQAAAHPREHPRAGRRSRRVLIEPAHDRD
jgi:4-hydroxybenzoyl-CoA thioesterase